MLTRGGLGRQGPLLTSALELQQRLKELGVDVLAARRLDELTEVDVVIGVVVLVDLHVRGAQRVHSLLLDWWHQDHVS